MNKSSGRRSSAGTGGRKNNNNNNNNSSRSSNENSSQRNRLQEATPTTTTTARDTNSKQQKRQELQKSTKGIYRNLRFVDANSVILGRRVLLRVKSNATYQGTFVTFSPEYGVLLEGCHKVDSKETNNSGGGSLIWSGRSGLARKRDLSARYFERECIVEMRTLEIDDARDETLSAGKTRHRSTATHESGFTDAAIAHKQVARCSSTSSCVFETASNKPNEEFARDLEPFLFDDNDNYHDDDDDEDDEDDKDNDDDDDEEDNRDEKYKRTGNGHNNLRCSKAGGWKSEDMLLVNQIKYGYKSTYNSDMSEYTMSVVKENTAEYRRREQAAEMMALEIESSATYRKNVDKELFDSEDAAANENSFPVYSY